MSDTCPHEMIYVTSSTMAAQPRVKCTLPKGHEGPHQGEDGRSTTKVIWPPQDAA
jgi:hypothetical protein